MSQWRRIAKKIVCNISGVFGLATIPMAVFCNNWLLMGASLALMLIFVVLDESR